MKICVFLHVFYMEMLDEMLDYLANLSENKEIEYDLLVTMPHVDKTITNRIYAFKDNAQIIQVANRGYDVAPFLYALKQVDVTQYDYIIKMHTKRTLSHPAYLPSCTFRGDEWRNKLLEFMSEPSHIAKAIRCFEKCPDVGMVSAAELIIPDGKEDTQASAKAAKIIRGMGLPLRQRRFVAGTMFMARAKLFRLLKMLPYEAEDFEEFNPSHQGGTLAHALERVLGMMIYAQGYKITSYNNQKIRFTVKATLYKIRNFLFYKRINSKNKLHIKICKIPVYSKQL
ncbi:MAG: hypothetical protein IJ660_02875 [Alphaproteobacteria bacterium]|nr:hypothetical protein [Alphaproteobacteria bacterium]